MNLSNFILCIFIAFLWSLQPILHKMLKKNIDVFILFLKVFKIKLSCELLKILVKLF